jgi:hypothetical protein
MTAPDPVRAIADAVLYEGYVLWPYRRSALKNTQRWTFGGVHPRAHSEARAAGDDPWTMQTQCLVEGPLHACVAVEVRFLHVVWRQVIDANGATVDALTCAGERHLSWEEAAERAFAIEPTALLNLASGRHAEIAIESGYDSEPLEEGGRLERSWEPLEGLVAVRAEQLADELHCLTVKIENTTPWEGGARSAALRRTFCSTHTVLHVADGAFVSQTDPPPELAVAAATCENRGTWPILVGPPGSRDTLLSSPIILSDHPEIAPESPGELFDSGEIDQLLTLNILSLTDEEKEEMRATDPRVRALLERTERLTAEELMRMHGTIRELQVRSPARTPGGSRR